MSTVAEVIARTLRDLGVTRMFGLPGGEVLDLIEAARRTGVRFYLTRREATASFMADAAGQMERKPGVCVATLGPGAVNMVLGVANAYLDRSPVLAITASLARNAAPYSTHQNLDLNAVYAPFTKASWTLDGRNTAATIERAWALALEPRMGPVHLALPSDVAASEDRVTDPSTGAYRQAPGSGVVPQHGARHPHPDDVARAIAAIREARRPVIILGLDLAPYEQTRALLPFIETMNVPVFVAPKAKGALPEDHPLFYGVCAGVAADHVILDFFRRADLLVGIGYDPVESNRIWHHTLKLLSIGTLSIAAGAFRPTVECVGDVEETLNAVLASRPGPFEWTETDLRRFRDEMATTLHPAGAARVGLSPYELTRELRRLVPRDTIVTTDVGAVKFITSQAFTTYEPMTFLQSNGLSSMGFAFPAAMAARLVHPDRPVLCTVGDGGFGMSLSEVETCAREGIAFVTVVFNDSQLSLIEVIQRNKGLPGCAVGYNRVDFAAAAEALGAIGLRVTSLEGLEPAMAQAMISNRLAVIDVQVDPTEYRAHTRPWMS